MADKTIIHVQVQDQKLVLLDGPVVATGGVNGTAVQFDLSSKWSGMVLMAVFQREEKGATVYHSSVDSSYTAVIPQEVLKEDGTLLFGLYGVLDDMVRTSELMRYRVRKGAVSVDTEPGSPTPELWEQLLNAVSEVTPVVQKLREDFDAFKIEVAQDFDDIQALTDTDIDAAITAAETEAEESAEGEDDGSTEIS